jgi:hypothetical protein
LRMPKKAQSGIEFLILIGAVFFFFVTLLMAFQLKIGDKNAEQRTNDVRDLAVSIRNEIDLASGTSDGYYREFSIPNSLSGIDYDVSINDSFIYLRTNDSKNAIAFSVQNVTGQPKKGTNIIQKKDGIVYLN